MTRIYPLAECLTRQEQFDYNQKQGLEKYIDPFAKLFCVKVNNSPDIGNYFLVNETEPASS